jgi:Xaa-Pro dipeptidase
LLNGVNSDSGLNVHSAKLDFPKDFEELEKRVDYNPLIYEVLAETRATKTEEEISLLKYINEITIEAHIESLKATKPDIYERDVENVFFNYLRQKYFVRIWAYPMICGCGTNSSTLHYQDNCKKLKDGDLILLDMGIRYAGYTSDVTSTVPVNGKFSEKQAAIYNIVLNANQAVQKNLKAGSYWPAMHLVAERVILQGLIDLDILNKGFNIFQMLKDRVAYYFMPHGLGHLMGVEVHDVGGYLSFTPKRPADAGLSSLRTARYLSVNTVITVEPGIYFIPFLLEKALSDENLKKYFNGEKVRSYFDFGGVRIEDDVVITSEGCINLTAGLPRTVDEIENLMKKK